jgi:hypothetical protein
MRLGPPHYVLRLVLAVLFNFAQSATQVADVIQFYGNNTHPPFAHSIREPALCLFSA